jgi:hypothetical protein
MSSYLQVIKHLKSTYQATSYAKQGIAHDIHVHNAPHTQHHQVQHRNQNNTTSSNPNVQHPKHKLMSQLTSLTSYRPIPTNNAQTPRPHAKGREEHTVMCCAKGIRPSKVLEKGAKRK